MMSFGGKGQQQYNLVPNPSFEDYIECPSSFNSPPPIYWYMPTNYGISYYNACAANQNWSVPYNHYFGGIFLDYQNARTGNAYIGAYLISQPGLDQRNYFQVKLKDSLQKDRCYYAEFYVVFVDDKKLKTNNVSMLLTNTAVYVDTVNYPYGVLPANAQIYNYGNPIIKDTQNWVKVSSIYVAQGGEQYLTLGNFKYDVQTDYIASQPTGYDGGGVFFDDVFLSPLDSFPVKADAGKDTSIVNVGDSIFIGSLTNGLTGVKWYNSSGAAIDTGRPGFYVKPTVSTFYVIEQMVCGYYSRDTVKVNVGTVPLKMMNYELRMMNDRQIENRWVTANEVNVSHFNIQRSTNNKDFVSVGKVSANNKSYNEYSFIDVQFPSLEVLGVGYYRIESIDKNGKKDYSETRTLNFKPQTLNSVSIFPNPARDIVTISCKGAKELLIIDYLGRIVKQFNNPTEHQTLNTKQFTKGLYIVKVVTANGATVVSKFVKE